MGCGNCGTGANGKPAGCQSNGGCSSGGCNRMNVFDWLGNLPIADYSKPYSIIEVSFNKGSRKDFFRNNTPHILEKGQMITVEGVGGIDVGMVNLTGELVKLQMQKYGVKDDMNIKRIMRLATEDDLTQYYHNKDREQEVMVESRAIARQLKLEMKICEVEIQADGKKATFFYTAENRVDFRELIKHYASSFKVKVEMKQIGARQESGKVGGIGSCGRELCCSTWLSDFKSVNTSAARYQNLSINQAKLSGQCGRLKCCLNYELDTYMDALKHFPENVDVIETISGVAFLQKKDIFKNLMWYSFKDSNKQYPLTITQVKEILEMNKKGMKPEALEVAEVETRTHKAPADSDVGFVNDVGQLSLKSLERSKQRKKTGPPKNQQQGGNKGFAHADSKTKNPNGSGGQKNTGRQKSPSGGNAPKPPRKQQSPQPPRSDRRKG